MTAVIDVKRRPETFERRTRILMPDGSDFVLILRNPSFEFRVDDLSGRGGWEKRFETLIVGWEGISVRDDNGNESPLGYSLDNLKRVCENYPTVFDQATTAIFLLMNPPNPKPGTDGNGSDDSQKNSVAPSETPNSDGGTKSASETETTS
jgi:hypothetical protein